MLNIGNYIHSSQFGTYHIICKIIRSFGIDSSDKNKITHYEIEYEDPWSNEIITKEVEKDRVIIG